LLGVLRVRGYFFQTVEGFIKAPKDKTIILRHDVDRIPENALRLAKLEHELGIGSTYYFRAVQESWNENIIREIASIGHEIGYHYENLSEINCLAQRRKGAKKRRKDGKMKDKYRDELFELAIDDFRLNLEKLRKLYPVKTICMHGSPLSKWDNRDLCKKYDYRDFGIIAEPYFDVDFSEVLYLTDTGRRWDGDRVSVRDKVKRTEDGRQRTEVRGQRIVVGGQKTEVEKRRNGFENLRFRSTFDIIEAVEKGLFPDKVLLNTHP